MKKRLKNSIISIVLAIMMVVTYTPLAGITGIESGTADAATTPRVASLPGHIDVALPGIALPTIAVPGIDPLGRDSGPEARINGEETSLLHAYSIAQDTPGVQTITILKDLTNPGNMHAPNGREIIFESGRLANQAHGAVWIQCGGTVVLVTVCSQTLEFDKVTETVKQTERLGTVLYNLLESLRYLGVLIAPFLPETGEKILDVLNVPASARTLESLEKFGVLEPGTETGEQLALFARIDEAKMLPETCTMDQADVGLMSMYVMDCKALAEIAALLGKTGDREELLARGEAYGAKLQTLWDEKTGIFRNKRLGTNQFLDVLTPCNFYPMLAGVATEAQAERMMKEHYFNPEEFYGEYVMPSSARNARGFNDNTYWRGRIWGPMNFLVYLGMRDYKVDAARKDLVERSRNLLMKNWKLNGGIYENYNSVTGFGGDHGGSDAFYHWGALLTYMGIMEDQVR